MNATVEEALSSVLQGPPWQPSADDLRATDCSIVAGQAMADWAGVAPGAWTDFADYWNRLTLDRFMGDGGTYRLRRYGQFETDSDGQLRQLPHSAYEQASSINRLNGGIARVFDPLEPGFAQHAVLHRVLNVVTHIVNDVEGKEWAWNIKLHPYRILAAAGVAGQPTPEGLHRDGVDYVVSMLVKRTNVVGGESAMTDAHRRPLGCVTLLDPLQMLILNDANTLHAVTPVVPRNPLAPAYRDVLVIAFEKVRGG